MALVYDSKTAESMVGFKITCAVEDDSGEGFYGFRMKKGKKEVTVWVLRDEEGNGPGCLDAEGL